MTISPEAIRQRFPSCTSGLARGDADALAAALVRREVAPGDVLIREGSRSDILFLLREGTMRVEVAVAGVPHEVGRMEAGAVFGEISFLDGGLATATVTAVTPAVALTLSTPGFDGLAGAHPAAASALLHGMCSSLAVRLRTGTVKIEALLAGPTSSLPTRASWLTSLRQLLGLAGD